MLPRTSRSALAHIAPNVQRGVARHQSTAALGETRTLTSRLKNVLIANRGEIALRVNRTAEQHGIRTTTLYTGPDALAPHALASPFALNLGTSANAYLDGPRIVQLARKHDCDAVHPGYGFLSEDPGFAQACADAGLTFVGPPPAAIAAMGNKARSKEIMTDAGVPCVPGYHGKRQEPEYLMEQAERIGYPVLLKAVRGGGGKGMRIVQSQGEFLAQLESAKSEARSSCGDDVMLVEKYIQTPRHIEVQVFADKHGNCVALGERDCSIQRRHQKILEESPAPDLEEHVRQDLWAKARAAALAVNYEGAGTVEFIFDNVTRDFYFMEMNTRLQVEHPVTEMVTGEDLVHWQFLVAEGGKLPLNQEEIHERIRRSGWAIEARIYAENPDVNFVPDSGKLTHLLLPPSGKDVRVDAGFVEGNEISSHYDPMIAKLIVRGRDRNTAIQKVYAALASYEIAGPITNVEFLKRVCAHPDFAAGDVETGFITKHHGDLFPHLDPPQEVFAQAALASLLSEADLHAASSMPPAATSFGFTSTFQTRELRFKQILNPGEPEGEEIAVRVNQTRKGVFDIQIKDRVFPAVRSDWDRQTSALRSFFPQQRLDTRLIFDEGKITVFQLGAQYRLQLATPKWLEKALGVKDSAHSVLAPMPCKILRVDVKEGQDVRKDQTLLVIESMKMETVIRSPQNGTIARVVHKQGDLCKAGTALVEFKD